MTEKNKKQTLWNRLKEDHKLALEVASYNYPFTVTCIREELQKTNFIHDLTFGTVTGLCCHTISSDANKIYNLFDPYDND